MRVLVIGGTGYIGGVIVERLLQRGDTPVAVSRSGSSELPAGADSAVADVGDPERLTRLARDADAVVYAAAPSGDWDVDAAALTALIEQFGGSGRPLIYTSGIWALGAAATYDGGSVDEDATTDALDISSGRPRLEQLVLDARREDVRAIVIRPGIVYGRGGGIPSMLVGWAREDGAGRYAGESEGVRWPMVHVDDLADLYMLVLDHGASGSLLHATSETGVRVGSLAAAADLAVGGAGSATGWPFEQAAEALGRPFTEALVHDQVVTSDRARELGWSPRHIDAAADLAAQR